MLKYSPSGCVLHKVVYTLQIDEYKGAFSIKVKGTHKGLNVLYNNIFELIQNKGVNIEDNNCLLEFNKRYKTYSFVLINNEGDTKEFVGYAVEDMREIVVGIKIQEYQLDW